MRSGPPMERKRWRISRRPVLLEALDALREPLREEFWAAEEMVAAFRVLFGEIAERAESMDAAGSDDPEKSA